MNAIRHRTTPRTINTSASRPALAMKLGMVTSLVACAGCTLAPAGEPTSTSTPPGPASPAAPAAATVSIQGVVQASDGSPVARVAVCLRPDAATTDHESCTTSDGTGAWKLAGVPYNFVVAITFIKGGFFPTLRTISTATTDVTIAAGDGTLISSSEAASLMGGPIDPESGHIAFSIATQGTQPSPPSTVALGAYSLVGGYHAAPVYFDASGKPALGATSGTGGVFANVPPGTYVVRFFGASVACSNIDGLYGYPFTLQTPDGQARLAVPVVAGFLTAPVVANCSPVRS
jgi:hypothetical protein